MYEQSPSRELQECESPCGYVWKEEVMIAETPADVIIKAKDFTVFLEKTKGTFHTVFGAKSKLQPSVSSPLGYGAQFLESSEGLDDSLEGLK